MYRVVEDNPQDQATRYQGFYFFLIIFFCMLHIISILHVLLLLLTASHVESSTASFNAKTKKLLINNIWSYPEQHHNFLIAAGLIMIVESKHSK